MKGSLVRVPAGSGASERLLDREDERFDGERLDDHAGDPS
jgi:hypothetical protein